jgi:alpha-1,2-mannosyltransferase
LLALLFVANGPLLSGVDLGNLSYGILLPLVCGLALIRAGRHGAAGAMLGVAAILKPPLLLFGLYFLLRRDLRGVAGFAGVCAAVGLLSLAVFGWDANLYWFQSCIVAFSHNWVAAFNVQSVPSFLYRLHGSPDLLTDWLPHRPTPADAALAMAVTLGFIAVAALACLPSRGPREPSRADTRAPPREVLQFLLVLCLALVASPLTWSHYFAWLLIPTAYFLGPLFPNSKVARTVGWSAIALITPLTVLFHFQNASLEGAYVGFGTSLPLLGALLWFGLVAWWMRRSGGEVTSNASQQRGAPAISGKRARAG